MTSRAPKLKPSRASATKNMLCVKLIDMMTRATMVTTRLMSSDF